MPYRAQPISVETYTLGELDTNCYLVWEEPSYEAILIDPGDAGDFLADQIRERKLHLSAILLTHGHFDHALGLLALRVTFPDVPICLHAEDEGLLARAQASAEHWLKHPVDPVPSATMNISESSQFHIGSQLLSVIATPGHTPGSCSFHISTPKQELLFTGDTLFKAGVGRTDFSYSKPLDLELSVQSLFDTFSADTVCFCGHGEVTTIGAEITGAQD